MNGELLQLAQSQFDVFLTTDQNLQYEQNIASLAIAIVVLCSNSNRLAELQPLIPKFLSIVDFCKPGTATRVGD